MNISISFFRKLAPIILLFTLSAAATVQSQSKQDTILASRYYQKADSLLTAVKADSSILYFEKALPLYQKAKVWEKVASCYNKISENHSLNYQQQKSLKNSTQALNVCTNHLSKDHKEEANAYSNLGKYHENIPNYDQALEFYKKALNIRRKLFPENHEDIAFSYGDLGILYIRRYDFKKALKYHQKALDIFLKIKDSTHREIGLSYGNIGVAYELAAKYTKALSNYEKALEIGIINNGENHYYTSYNYGNIGNINLELFKYDTALHYYKKALPALIKKKDSYSLNIVYNNIGACLSRMGKFNDAYLYYKKSLKLSLETHGENHPFNANIYTNIGHVFKEKEEYQKSLDNYSKSLQIYKNLFGENHYNIGRLNEYFGDIYFEKKEYKISLKYYIKSLTINLKLFEKNDPNLESIYIKLANLYFKQGKYNKSMEFNKKVLKTIQTNYRKSNVRKSNPLKNIAVLYSKKQDYCNAISQYNKAILSNCKIKKSGNFDINFNPNEYYDLLLLLNILKEKANTLQAQYKISEDINYLNESIVIYQNLDTLIYQIRQSYQNHQDKLIFAKDAKEIYNNAIKAHLLLYKETKNQETLRQAFYCAEKSKANTLKELLNNSNAKDVSGLPQSLLETEKNLRTNRAFYQSQRLEEQSHAKTDTSKIREYENQLFDIYRKQDSLSLVLEKEYPKYYQLKHQNTIISVSEIQNRLQKNTTLLEFFVADSTTYAFSISKKNMKVTIIETKDLTNTIQKFPEAIINKDTKEYKKEAHLLYQKIIAPVKDQLIGDELIIIPDGALWHLNFELLVTQQTDSNNPKEFLYLLNQYAISYANSANLLFNSFKSKKNKKENECLAFSFTDTTNIGAINTMSLASLRDSGDDLPGTRKEISAIADIIDGQYYYGSNAIEANFKQYANQYNILHLALHGEVDNERPENSKLYFTKSKDTLEDNLLYSHELFALNIPAELTVLSACNTGSGKIAKGEGIMSLGNAFQYAGTKSLLLTSWEVSDQTTPELMKLFYTYLKKGMSKAKALRQAKLQFLNNTELQHSAPFYWGGFYLTGDTAPIKFANKLSLYWIILGVLLLVFLAIYIWKKRGIAH